MKYRMKDGTIINTARASARWIEATDFNGRNQISRATGSQWNHETLYRSRRGRYYIECTSQWQGSQGHCEWISPERAAAWLSVMDADIPAELTEVADQIEE